METVGGPWGDRRETKVSTVAAMCATTSPAVTRQRGLVLDQGRARPTNLIRSLPLLPPLTHPSEIALLFLIFAI